MKNFASHIALYACALTLGFSCKPATTLQVSNDSNIDRKDEMVSIPFTSTKSFVLLDENGKEVAYQLTYDDQLIFQSSVTANSTKTYTIKAGTPAPVETIVTGKQYPERVDDIAWENDRIAFRLYGPALQASGEKAYGYDIWAKRATGLVVAERYRKELQDKISYHKDNGNGLDYYKVGPTLGAGTAALINTDGSIIYPWCYKTYKVLDNGPLRFTVELTYPATTINGQAGVVEKRLLSMDAGTQFNKVSVQYEGLKTETQIATGIVLHDSASVKNHMINVEKKVYAYADPASPKNGQQYVAVFNPNGWSAVKTAYFDKEERKMRANSFGHLLGLNTYKQNDSYTYYFGAGWSKWGFEKPADWFNYAQEAAEKLIKPLTVTVK